MAPRSHLLRFAQQGSWQMQYPMGIDGSVAGDGCYVRHAYAVEHAEYFPGLWHTGENWFLLENDSASAPVYAVAAGDVVFVGYDYPGLVVIIQHADALFSQYGHLDREPLVAVGQQVEMGDVIGRILYQQANRSHLHFELRSFLTHPDVNGPNPRYSFHCGPNCPPGPGYWPMDAPEHPSAIGWMNPLHVINHGMGIPDGAEVMVPTNSWAPLFLWNELADATRTDSTLLPGGTRLPLVDIWAGDDASFTVGASSTNLWYRVVPPGYDQPMWCPAIAPTMHAIQQNGETASFVFTLIPALE